MLIVMTDFGLEGPYLGQVRAVLERGAPGVPVIDLFSDLPSCNPHASSVLVARYSEAIAPPAVFLCVVDPGVGGVRRALLVKSRGCWFVGPDNGLLDRVAAADPSPEFWEITLRPAGMSASFHGRDLFAPVAAHMAAGGAPEAVARPLNDVRVSDDPDLCEVVYIDHFGNAMTGIRSVDIDPDARLVAVGRIRTELGYGRTFCEVPPGALFWYGNANGLVEIACNGARAADKLGLAVGDRVGWLDKGV
ncbi:MAG: hypothetical protein GC138_08865 [Gammaproteobacteria bacterium]|nr:hypothetical protein [Gammaproteobacteria bacterium]